MAQHDLLYSRAFYYDVALARDISKEVDFIPGVFRRHAGRELKSVLEIACGPGYHALALARRGLRAAGLDYSRDMIALARQRSAKEGVEVEWVKADMRDFQLDEAVDMAVCLFDGVDALLEDDDFISHLHAVARNLNDDGLYLIDCTHPSVCSYQHYGDYFYEGRRDGVEVEILWATNRPAIDPVTGVAEVELEMRVQRNGNREVIRDVARERCFTAPELRLLARASGVFRPVGWYGAPDLDRPLDRTPGERMILILQRAA